LVELSRVSENGFLLPHTLGRSKEIHHTLRHVSHAMSDLGKSLFHRREQGPELSELRSKPLLEHVRDSLLKLLELWLKLRGSLLDALKAERNSTGSDTSRAQKRRQDRKSTRDQGTDRSNKRQHCGSKQQDSVTRTVRRIAGPVEARNHLAHRRTEATESITHTVDRLTQPGVLIPDVLLESVNPLESPIRRGEWELADTPHRTSG